VQFTPDDQLLIAKTAQTKEESLRKYLRLKNNDSLDESTNNAFLIAEYFEPIYHELLSDLRQQTYLQYSDSGIGSIPFTISSNNAGIIFEIAENEYFYEFELKIEIENLSLPINEFTYFSPFCLMKQNEAWFLTSKTDDYLLNNALKSGEILKINKNNFEKLFTNFIEPMSKKYKIKNKTTSIKSEIYIPNTKVKQLYISDVDKFVLFKLFVNYDDKYLLNILDSGTQLIHENGKLIEVQRDTDFEKGYLTFVKTLHTVFAKPTFQDYYYMTFDNFLNDYWFFDFFEKLRNEGVEIFGIDKLKNFKYSPHKAKVAVQISSGQDWFDLEVNISFGNIEVALKDVRKAIINREKYIKLSDGSLGLLPEEWIKKLEAYFRQGELKSDKIAEELREKKKKIKEFEEIQTLKAPKELKGTLRDYQLAGFNWLNFLNEFKWGGILADDMGLGKTIQVISFLLHIHKKQKNASLVVVPTTLLFNWENELKKFAPSLKVLFHYGTSRSADTIDFKNVDVVVSTYGIVSNDIETFRKYKFSYVILDESQAIKNPESQRFKAVCLLKAENRLALTGTPIENNTFDLYAQLEFLNPGFLGTKAHFKEEYSDFIDKNQDAERATELQRIINPFVLRRTKEQVAKELPEKTEDYLFCEMQPEQRKVYEAFKHKYRNFLLNKIEEEGIGKSKLYVLEGLTKLRQICDSPAILNEDEDYGNESIKIAELMRNIKEKTGKHKILVFSQFVRMLSEIEKNLKKDNITYEYLDGQSSQKERQASVENFQDNDKCRVFLISLRAGGMGINLTSADYVYLVDPWWNPAVENQAIDRTHRIGQDKKVIAYRMICKDTIEEKIMKHQERKQKIASDIITTEENFVKQLTKEDITDLFG